MNSRLHLLRNFGATALLAASLLLFLSPARAATLTWGSSATGTWDTGTNWNSSTAAWTNDSDALFNNAVADTVTIGGTVLVNSLTQTTNGTAAAISGGTLQLDGTAGIVNSGNSALTINSAVTLNNNITINAGNAITIGGAIGELSGPRSITKIGANTLTLSNVNTYTGATQLSAGTLALTGTGSVASSAISVLGGTLTIGSGSGTITRGASLTLGGGTAGTTANFTATGVASTTTNDAFTGALNIGTGQSNITLTPNATGQATVTFGSLGTRAAGSIAFISGAFGGTPGVNNTSLIFTTAPSGSNLVGGGGLVTSSTASIIPWLRNKSSNQFLGYDATKGITPVSTVNNLTSGAFTNVSLTGNQTLSADQTINSLVGGSIGITMANHTLTVTSGAVMADVNLTIGSDTATSGTLALGSAEGQFSARSARTLTVNSAITGSGGLTLTPDGSTIVLSGANTYTGVTNMYTGGVKLTNSLAFQNTTVNYVNGNGATLTFGNGGATGQTAYTFGGLSGSLGINLNNNNTSVQAVALTVGGDNDSTTYSGVLSSTVAGGSLIKTGAGTLTLSGANTFGGGMTINAGTVMSTVSAGFGAGTVAIGASGTANVTFAADANVSNVFTGSGVLTASGSNGTPTFNSASGLNGFTGTLNVNTSGGKKVAVTTAGEKIGSGATVNITSAGTLYIANTTASFDGVTFNVVGSGNTENLGAIRIEGNSVIGATSSVVLGGNASFGGNSGTGTINAVISESTASAVTKVGGSTLILGGSNTYTGTTTISAGTLNLSNQFALQNSTLSGGSTVFDSSVTGNAFTFGGLAGSTNLALQNNAGTPAAVALTVGGNNATTSYSAILSGSGSLTKTGTGTLTLSGQNTYNGGTTVNSGTLALGHATNTLADTGAVNVNGGVLSLGGNSDTVGAVTLTSGSITSTTGALTGSSYDVQSGTVSAKLGGSGVALTKSTGGTATLSGANTYSGGTTINSGTLVYANNAALGTGTATLNGSTLKAGSASNWTLANAINVSAASFLDSTGRNSTLNGNISGGGNLTFNATGSAITIALNGDNSGYTGTMTFNNTNAVSFTSANAGSSGAAWVFNDGNNDRVRINITGTNTINFGSIAGNGQIQNDTASSQATLSVGALNTSGTFSGTIKDGAADKVLALTKVGSGNLTLTGNSTYSGTTTVSNGTLTVNGLNSGTGQVTVASGATLAGSGTIAGATVVSGTLSGNLTLNNDATIDSGVSAAANAFNGNLVNNGTISTAVTVASGKALSGNGSFGDNLTVNGSMTMGTSGIGSVAVGNNLSFSGSASLVLALGKTTSGSAPVAGTDYGQVTVGGNLSLSGTLALTIGTGIEAGDVFYLAVNNGTNAIAGAFSGFTVNGVSTTLDGNNMFTYGGQDYQLSYTADFGGAGFESLSGNDVALIAAVPEPSTWAMMISGLGVLSFWRRSRRKSL